MVEKNDAAKKIIVALDTASLSVTERLVRDLEGLVSFYKVGTELFTAHGWQAVEFIRKKGGRVFLDLKLHDIPNTVSKTMAVMCEHDIFMVTVHALGGRQMMESVRRIIDERAETGKKRPKVLGVTVLTSHSQAQMNEELGMPGSVKEQVVRLAKLAHASGLDGIVSSPRETAELRRKLPKDFLMVTPGVRPAGSEKKDQKRTFTPHDALQAGADYLVIGRPITEAAEPAKMVENIIASIG